MNAKRADDEQKTVAHLLAAIFANIDLEVTRWRQPIAQIFADIAANLRHGTDPEEVAIICDGAAEMILDPASFERVGRRLRKELAP
jgi:hypothetical protein